MSYITQKAKGYPLKGLASANWKNATDQTIANLYWYFKERRVAA